MNALLSPLGAGLLLALVLLLSWRRLPRGLRWIGALLAIVLVVSVTPLGANALVRLIETRVPPAESCGTPSPDTIVVLSAGFQREPITDDDFAALRAESIQRALSGVQLWRRTPGATLVFAGGGPFAISESALLQRFAEQLGVPAQVMRREDRSQTTWENALQLRDLKPPLAPRIWLVSSALHLPRAQIAFQAQGFAACAYASARVYIPPGGIGYYVPQSSALIKTEAALHELVGELQYRWRAAGH